MRKKEKPLATKKEIVARVRAELSMVSGLEIGKVRMPRVSCMRFHKEASFESYLIAVRKDGKDIYEADRVRFAVLRVTRYNMSFENGQTELVTRCAENTDAFWHAQLRSSCARLGVDPACLEHLGSSNERRKT